MANNRLMIGYSRQVQYEKLLRRKHNDVPLRLNLKMINQLSTQLSSDAQL
jgi:hypothetical protein